MTLNCNKYERLAASKFISQLLTQMKNENFVRRNFDFVFLNFHLRSLLKFPIPINHRISKKL